MWVVLSMLALVMLVVRRSTEKTASKSIDSMTLSWLQQSMALPFIIATLFFAKFYWPGELPTSFWHIMAIYVACTAIDLFLYFKALSIADVSYVAPLMSLIAVGNVVGAYFVLDQKPSLAGISGAVMVVIGAYVVNKAKQKDKASHRNNRIALFLILLLVVVRSYYSNIELFMLRDANPTTFNFYSSLLTVPLLLVFAIMFHHGSRTQKAKVHRLKNPNYFLYSWRVIRTYMWPLLFIGLTYTINLTATYQAKMLSPNAGYVGAIKSAQVLPMMLVGVLIFREKVVRAQWYGLAFILAGLIALSLG